MRKSLKTALAVITSIAALVSIAGCGRSDSTANKDSSAVSQLDSSKAKGNISVWAMGNEGEKMRDFVKGFEKENPDAKVTVTSIPWTSYKEKFQTAIAAGTGPDLVMIGNTDMATYGSALSEVPKNFNLSDLDKGLKKSAFVKNKQIGVPWYVDTRVVFYRTDIAKQAGWDHAPTTWDELKEMAQAMKKVPGVDYGIFIPVGGFDSFQAMMPFGFTNGADLVTKDNKKYTFDTPELKGAMNYVAGYFKDGLADPSPEVTPGYDMAQFSSGKAPLMIGGPTTIGQVSDLGGPGFGDKFATAVLPAKSKGGKSTSYVGGCNFSVFKTSKNKQSAWKFIKWFTSPKTEVAWYKATTDLPASSKAWDDQALATDTKLMAFHKQLSSTHSMPVTTTWGQMGSAADKVYEKICKGQISVDDGLKQMQQQADSIGTGM